MPTVSVSQAAAALGFKSRSTLYRLRDAGALADYTRPPASPGGAERLELQPRGLPHLSEHVRRLIRQQSNTPAGPRRQRADPRWGVVAAALGDALADCGGLQLSADEAAAIAAALPAALAEGFGPEGLEWLRVALADAGCWQAGPPAPDPEALREWWGDGGWGRFEPGEALEAGPFWEHVAGIVAGMMGGPFEQLTGPNAAELHRQLGEAVRDVEAGARWDAERWAAATAGMLLADLADDPADATAAADLAQLLEAAQLPPDLAQQAQAAIAAQDAATAAGGGAE